MSIGVDHIEDPVVLRAKLQEMDAGISDLRAVISQIVQNVTLEISGSNFTVIARADEPPHPTGDDTVIWRQTREGSPDVFMLSAKKTSGAKTWLWFGEAS